MRKLLAFLLILALAPIQVFANSGTSSESPAATTAQEDQWQILFTPEQLENLLAPIALYPDPLLAQVLLAATFPDQIDQAARTMRAYYNRYDVDSANWDVSVKAVAHYPSVLSMMADKLDWTTSVGQAYVNQSTDVMDAIQHLRRQARSMGNLMTTPQQEIVETGGYIYIYPAQPQYIYVPTYDPAIVYFRRPVFFAGPLISFGIGFMIGAWLNHDCDWDHHRVFYHGWEHGPVWVARSRPFIRVSNLYVNPRFQNVIVNRTVIDRHVNYGALDRYRAIHRDTDFSKVRRQGGPVGARRVPMPAPGQPRPDNQIIRRNIDPNDARIDANRGRGQWPQIPPQARRDIHPQIQTPPPVTGPVRRPDEHMRRPDFVRTQPPPPPAQPQGAVTPAPQPVPQRPGNVQAPRWPSSVFGGNAGAINSRDASRRGQASLEHAHQPPPAVKNVPPPQAHNTPPGQAGRSGQPHERRPR